MLSEVSLRIVAGDDDDPGSYIKRRHKTNKFG